MKSRMLWSVVLAFGMAGIPAVSFVHAQDKPSTDELAQAVQQRMKAGLEKRNMERATLDNDPKVLEAKTKLDQANKDWDALLAQVDEAVKSDPDYAAAKTKLDQAETKMTEAKKALATAAKAQRQAEIQQEKSRAQQRSSGSYNSGSSSSSDSSYNTQPKVNPLASQIKQVKDAEQEANKVRLEMNQIKMKLQRQMETKDDWKAAKQARDKAKSDYDAAVRPALAALRKKPEYQALVKQEEQAQAKIDQARLGQ